MKIKLLYLGDNQSESFSQSRGFVVRMENKAKRSASRSAKLSERVKSPTWRTINIVAACLQVSIIVHEARFLLVFSLYLLFNVFVTVCIFSMHF